MTILQLGCFGIPFSKYPQYGRKLPAVELLETFTAFPQETTLVKWRNSAPEGFCFVLRCHQSVTHMSKDPSQRNQTGHFRNTPTVEEGWQKTVGAAQTLGAQAIVFETPTTFTPTAENRKRLMDFLERTGEHRSRFTYVWDPKGPWSEEELEECCSLGGLVPCVDPSRDPVPKGPIAFGRLPGLFGSRPNYSVESIQEAVEALCQWTPQRAYLFLGNRNSFSDAQKAVSALHSELSDTVESDGEDLIRIGEESWMPEL